MREREGGGTIYRYLENERERERGNYIQVSRK